MNNRIAQLTILSIAFLRFNLRSRLVETNLTEEEFNTILEFFGGVRDYTIPIKEPEFYSIEAPDICAVCYTQIGTSAGGRIRNGCPYCRTRSAKLWDDLIVLKAFSGLDSNEVDVYLSKIIAELF